MTRRFGLTEADITKICGILAGHPEIEQAILYGSRAKGNYTAGSDIDLTLRGGADLTQDVLYSVIHEFDDLLLPYTIDLSLFSSLHDPDFIEHIRRVGVLLYESKGY
jgi:predicted nucleotidyltransferase